MNLSQQEDAQILQKRTALAQAVSALYCDTMNQQERSILLPENLSQSSETLQMSEGGTQLSPQEEMAASPTGDTETSVASVQPSPIASVSALQMQQLQQVSAMQV